MRGNHGAAVGGFSPSRILRTLPLGLATLGILAAGLTLGIACVPTISELTVPLRFAPTDVGAGVVSVSPSVRVFVGIPEDQRTITSEIGENREHDRPVPIRAADISPVQFVHDAMVAQLRKQGFNIVDSADQADRLINMKLNAFEADESPDYNTQITLLVSVTDRAGNIFFQGSAAGQNSRFGKSLSVENYQQTTSDAMVDLTSKLTADARFSNAINSGAPAGGAMMQAAPPIMQAVPPPMQTTPPPAQSNAPTPQNGATTAPANSVNLGVGSGPSTKP